MRHVKENYDILCKEPCNINQFLLLHPLLIWNEIKKISKYSPFYTLEENGIKKDILIFETPITTEVYESKQFYIPENIPILIGGLEGSYYIESLGTYVDSRGITKEKGYKIIEKNTGNIIKNGYTIKYLGKTFAMLDDLIIAKNTILYNSGRFMVDEATNCLVLIPENVSRKTTPYLAQDSYMIYDWEGKCVSIKDAGLCAGYPTDEIVKAMKNTPKFYMPKIQKNAYLYEKMIISCLEDLEELKGCKTNNLIDLVKYLEEHNLELALDLNSLKVYKVDYKKYFDRIKAKENSQDGSKLVRRLKTSSSKNK